MRSTFIAVAVAVTGFLICGLVMLGLLVGPGLLASIYSPWWLLAYMATIPSAGIAAALYIILFDAVS